MARAKTRAANLAVPQSREDLAEFIRRIGDAQRRIMRIEAQMNDGIAALKQVAETEASAHAELVKRLTEGVRIYCEAHRSELTESGKTKHFEAGTGKVEWRNRPPSVRLAAGWKLEDVIRRIKKLNLPFVRIKEELDKEAILAADDKEIAKLDCLRVGSAGEDFIVTPFEAELTGAAR